MDSQPSIKIRIPEAEDFEAGASCIPVPHNVVYSTIDVLHGLLALWKREEGCEPDQRLWAPLVTAASQALAGLVAAHAAQRADSYDRFMTEYWEGCRKAASGGEASAHPLERAPSQQEPTGQNDAGWDF